MSQLVELDPDVYQDPKSKGHVYRYCIFEQLPNVPTVKNLLPKPNTDVNEICSSPSDSAVDIKMMYNSGEISSVTAARSFM